MILKICTINPLSSNNNNNNNNNFKRKVKEEEETGYILCKFHKEEIKKHFRTNSNTRT